MLDYTPVRYTGTHKMSGERIYRIWYGMLRRCFRDSKYKSIKVCDRWKDSFQNFYEDMGHQYMEHCKMYGSNNTTIDRKDGDGDYTKDNCRWATYKEQANNTSRVRKIEYMGYTKNLSEWSEYLGIPYSTFRRYINDYKLSMGDILNKRRGDRKK